MKIKTFFSYLFLFFLITLSFSCNDNDIIESDELSIKEEPISTFHQEPDENFLQIMQSISLADGMLNFKSFEQLDEITNLILSHDEVEVLLYLSELNVNQNIQIQAANHIVEKMKWRTGELSESDLNYSELQSDNTLFAKDYNLFWIVSNQDQIFKVEDAYYLVDGADMYTDVDLEKLKSAIKHPEKIAKLQSTDLKIHRNNSDTRGFSGTLWSDSETVVIGSTPIICTTVACCFINCISFCNIEAIGCPDNTGCIIEYQCGQENTEQEFTANSYWYTFKTYYCGWYCPYMNYKVRVNHSFQSSLPNANLSSNYKYKLNGTTYTLSQSGASSSISLSLTHQLGIIDKNDPGYIPNISHVSANCTGTAVNGQQVVLN